MLASSYYEASVIMDLNYSFMIMDVVIVGLIIRTLVRPSAVNGRLSLVAYVKSYGLNTDNAIEEVNLMKTQSIRTVHSLRKLTPSAMSEIITWRISGNIVNGIFKVHLFFDHLNAVLKVIQVYTRRCNAF